MPLLFDEKVSRQWPPTKACMCTRENNDLNKSTTLWTVHEMSDTITDQMRFFRQKTGANWHQHLYTDIPDMSKDRMKWTWKHFTFLKAHAQGHISQAKGRLGKEDVSVRNKNVRISPLSLRMWKGQSKIWQGTGASLQPANISSHNILRKNLMSWWMWPVCNLSLILLKLSVREQNCWGGWLWS